MSKLLSAGMDRLWKNKLFWACVAAALLISAGTVLNGCRQAMMPENAEYTYRMDDYYFNALPFLGFMCAVFTGMFLGTEYSDGTVRNKVIVGHTRFAIYMANFITCLAAAMVMLGAYLLGGLVGIPTLGLWQMAPGTLLILIAVSVALSAAQAAIFVFIGMASQNKAITAVAAILVALALLLSASMIYNKLREPEMYSGVIFTSNGMEVSEPSPNPEYVSGVQRTIYEFVLDALPTGQGILLANAETARPALQISASVAITILVSAGGIYIFSKKDLK